ncbi:MAG: hypothetical protein HQK65_01935 [Desulfamplus sp.]|nr:hypothetical protein [Desulfamplus sp.]
MKTEECELKLTIALAGVPYPERPKRTKQDIFNWMKSLKSKNDVIQDNQNSCKDTTNTFEEKMVKYKLELQEADENAKHIISSGSSVPDILRITALFQDYLEDIASSAASERSKSVSENYDWELKARSMLFQEAKTMVQSVSCDCTLNDYKRAVLKAFKQKDESGDWGGEQLAR